MSKFVSYFEFCTGRTDRVEGPGREAAGSLGPVAVLPAHAASEGTDALEVVLAARLALGGGADEPAGPARRVLAVALARLLPLRTVPGGAGIQTNEILVELNVRFGVRSRHWGRGRQV